MRTGKDRVQLDALDVPISLGGARVHPGDILLGFTYRDIWGDYRDTPFVSENDLAEKVRVNAGRTIPVIVMRGEKLLDGRLRIR